MIPPGWYPDPTRAASWRWWDGTVWTEHASTPMAPPGWFRSPDGGEQLRWWTGAFWTADTLETPTRAEAEPTPTFATGAALPAVIGIALSVIAGITISSVVFDHLLHSPTLAIATFYLPLYGGIAATCLLVSRRFGTGRLSQDFGLRFQVADLWRGALVFLSAAVAADLATVALRQHGTAQRTNDALRYGVSRLPSPAIAELAFAAVIAAPLLEELAFRGILQRALTSRIGVWSAVVLQAVLFGAYHFTPGLGSANLAYTVSRGAAGLILGLAAMRWKRLGPGVAGHALLNIVFVIAVVAAR